MKQWWSVACGALLLTAAARGQAERELFSDVPAEFRHQHLKYAKQPVYFECLTNGLAIYPDNVKVGMNELLRPPPKLRRILDDLEQNSDKKFLVCVQRPGASTTRAALYRVISGRLLEAGVEIVDGATPLAEVVKRPDFVLSIFSPGERKKGAVFECRDGRVVYVNHEPICHAIVQFVDLHRPLNSREKIREMERDLEARDFGDENYTARMEDSSTSAVRLQARPTWRGETAKELEAEGSRFRQSLARLSAKEDFVLFFVRENGLDAYHQARTVAEKAGFEWNASYLAAGDPLIFH